MEDPEVAAQEYTLTLAELKTNNKTQINLLTILAEDYKKAAEHIVDAIETHLLTVPPAQKLTVMYVCDSILKNVKKPNDYDKLFARKIVTMFEHVFRQGDEKVRSSLYKLRVTWASTGIFMPSKLYALDMKVNALDSAWPISNPRTGRALRDDPSVAPPTTPTNSASTSSSGPSSSSGASTSSSSSRVFVNPKFIDKSAPTSSTSTTPSKKTEKTKTPPSSASSGQKTVKKEPKQQNVDPLDKLLPSSSSTSGGGSSSTKSTPSSSAKRKAVPSEHSNAPIRKKSQHPGGSSSSSTTPKAPLDEDLRSINLITSRGGGGPPPRQTSTHDQDFRGRPLKPTSVAGSHAFAAPVRPLMPPLPSGPMHAPPGPMIPPPYRHHNSPPQDPTPLMMQTQMPPPPHQQQQQPANGAPPPPTHVYASEQTKLDLPANNRIFVDGKAYEVMFVDDTAVIERGGAPHRIYFAGAPRNLIIDGVPHLLPFDTPTTIDILGAKHIVKFGAPSRELYIGGHPFKGQFGGPPIVATINGRRHEIRLTGSAPEVRIEPEPAYHLTRFLHKMREEKKIEITAEKPKDTGDWIAYLKNLQKTGILPAKTNSSPRHQTPPPMSGSASTGSLHQRGRQQNRGGRGSQWGGKATMMPETQPPPPPPTSSGVEKRHVPPAAITDFNIRLLQIRYDSVVEMLVTKRADSCKFCGMRLDDSQGKSKEWKDHMDWHVKQNLARGSTDQTATYRMWYPTASTWLTARASDQPRKTEEREEPLPGVASSGVKAKECPVCQEKFDEYFDDDEEMWRLRDTVSVHGKIVHSSCVSDASTMDYSDVKQEPIDVDEQTIDDDDDIKHEVKHLIDSFEPKNALSSR